MKLVERYYKTFRYNLSNLDDVDVTGYEEVEVDGNDIKHWLDTGYTAKEIIEFAREIYPDSIDDNDLEEAYEVLIHDYDEIPELDEYIEEEIYNSLKYELMARDELAYDDELKDEEDALRVSSLKW